VLKNFVKDYLSYSRRERNGIILLITIILIIIIAYLLLPFININQEFNLSEYESEIEDFERSLKPANKEKIYNTNAISGITDYDNYQLFRFNPNTVNIDDLKKLGFNENVISNIVKYRKKDGCFHKKEDLLKIYGMDTSLFYRLFPYMYFDKNIINIIHGEEDVNNPVNKYYKPVNINMADTQLISELLGTNNLFPARIVKYRNLLGGFVNKNQINEIYGLNRMQINLIINNIIIDTALIRRININNADEQILGRHPYLNKYYARAIIKYRNFAGEIKRINELSVNNILPENIFYKIKPYLSVN
jgi:competence protein ComEA